VVLWGDSLNREGQGGPGEPAGPEGGALGWLVPVVWGAVLEGPHSTDSGVRPAEGQVGVGGREPNQHCESGR